MFEKNTFVKIFALLVLTLMVGSGLSSATKTTAGSLIVGGGDYYKVIIDERGQAIVIEELDFKNYGEQNVTELTFKISGKNVRIRYVMQVIAKEVKSGNYTYYQNKYVILPVEEISDGVYKVTLNQSVGKDSSGRIFIYYKAFRYTKKGLLADEFDFETTKWNFDVDYTRVSVSVAGDLVLKGGDSKGEYKNTLQTLDSVSAEPGRSITPALGNSLYYVRYDSGFVKQTQGLNPNESFHVCGTYSESYVKLYIPEILGLLLTIAGGWHVWKRYGPKPRKAEGKVVAKKGVDYARSVTKALVAAIGFSAVAAFLVAVTLNMYWHISESVFLMLVIGTGLLYPIGLFFHWKKSVGTKEAAVSSVLEFGFSLIFFPLALILFVMIVNFLSPPVYHL